MTGVVDAGATGAARTGNSSARFWVSEVRKSALGKTQSAHWSPCLTI